MAMCFNTLLALAALCTLISGCSPAAGIPASSAGIAPAGYSTAHVPKERVTITEFADLPEGYAYGPTAIASGPDKSLWVAVCPGFSGQECAIVQVATSGKALHTYYYSPGGSVLVHFSNIAAAPDGTLWVTDIDPRGEQILRMTTRGVYTAFPLDDRNRLFQIALGSDGALWFTQTGEGNHGAIGRITTEGAITKYRVAGMTDGIAAGPDKALWFTEPDAPAIGRITTTGKITLFSKGLSVVARPTSIAAGPDGALWFTELKNFKTGAIGRITTTGNVTEYRAGITRHEIPNAITAGPDGAMWFTEYHPGRGGVIFNGKLGRIAMSGDITEYSQGLAAHSGPSAIAQGPDRDMWFVDSYGDRTGRAALRPPR
jgi:virginiamycin B lyase